MQRGHDSGSAPRALIPTRCRRVALVVGLDPAARASAARALAHLCQLVEFFAGSRVEDYTPLLELVSRLAAPPFLTGKTLHSL